MLCTQCPDPNPEFYLSKGKLKQPCKECTKSRTRKYWSEVGSKRRRDGDVHRLRRYGVTLAEVIDRQGSSLCVICKTRDATCIDHDHETGVVRGALCRICNMALAYVENEEWNARARSYLGRG